MYKIFTNCLRNVDQTTGRRKMLGLEAPKNAKSGLGYTRRKDYEDQLKLAGDYVCWDLYIRKDPNTIKNICLL
jgi:hypothetical protein